MERLIEIFSNGQAAVRGCGSNCEYDYQYCKDYINCPTICAIYEKLAQYEETGLSPEQFAEANRWFDEREKAKCEVVYWKERCVNAEKENGRLTAMKRTIEVIFGRGFDND